MKLLWIVSFCSLAQCAPNLLGRFKGKKTEEIPENNLLTEFKCNVLYSTTYHMFFTKIIYFQSELCIDNKPVYFTVDYKTLHSLPLNDITLEPEIVKTINIMFNNNMEMESVWLLYIYMHKVNSFLKAATVNANSYGHTQRRKDNLDIHNLVETNLANDIRKTACNQYNYFNKQSANCENYKSFKNMINAAGNNGNQAIIETVKSNKSLLNSVVVHFKGLEADSSVNGGPDTFSGIEVLYFKNVLGHSSFFNEYSEYLSATYWSNIIANIDDIRRISFEDGLKGIKYLGLYQMTVVKALKTIILGLTWSYVRASPERCTTEFVKVLNRFIDVTALDGDENLKNFVKIVQKGCKKSIIEGIRSTLSRDTMFYMYLTIEPKTKKSHTELLVVAQSFLDYIRANFGPPTNFIHCSTFSRMANDRVKYKIDFKHSGTTGYD